MPKINPSSELLFIDFVILSMIIEFTENEGQPPSFGYLYDRKNHTSIINDWLTKRGVSRLRYTPITGLKAVQQSVERMRGVGLLTPSGSPETLEKAYDVMERIGSDWREWAVRVPYDEGTQRINWFDAVYAPEIA